MAITPPPACTSGEVLEAARSQGAALTIFRNDNGLLSKRVTLDSEGYPVITPAAHLSRGAFEVQRVENVSALANLINKLTPSQALCHGVPKSGVQRGIVVSEAKRSSVPNAITRSLECFDWGQGPGVMMMDMDLKGWPPEFADLLDVSTPEAAREVLCRACPELASASMVALPSASARLYRTSDGQCLCGLTGVRLYVFVERAEDIPRFGQRLFNRLVLGGFGFPFITRSGRVLLRTLIDSAVYSPERLDFIGGAACGDGVEQRRGEPILWNAESTAYFAPQALSAEDEAKLATILADLRASAADEAAEAQASYHAARSAAGRPIAATERDDGTIELAPDHAIELDDGELITVADILADLKRYHHRHCRDPLEPDYAPRGRQIAKIYAVGQHSGPVINSMAHGGMRYVLDHGGPVPDAVDAFDVPDEGTPAMVPLSSEGERLAALLGDAGPVLQMEAASIRGDLLAWWDVLQAAATRLDPLSTVLESVVWPAAEAASSRSGAAFRYSLQRKLAAVPVWRNLSTSDQRLLIHAVQLLWQKGTPDARVPRLIEAVSPREWLIDGLCLRDALFAIIGPTNQGKTWLALLIAYLVAASEDCPLSLDGRAVRTHGHVWYFTSEDPQGTALRVKALENVYGSVSRLHLFDDVLLLTGPLEESVRVLRSAAEQTSSSPALIVIDVFTDAVSGDDNSAEVIAPAMRQARVLGRMFGASVLLLHHANKANPKDPRGSSAFANAADAILSVSADATGIHMSWVKARSTPKGTDFHFHLRDGVVQNGPAAQMSESSVFPEGETLARIAGRVLHEIQTPATAADWNAAIVQAAPSCFRETTPGYRRTKLSRARKLALDRKWAAGEKSRFIIGPEAVPEGVIESSTLDSVLLAEEVL